MRRADACYLGPERRSGSSVQLSLKERIWNGVYIELGQLLKMDPSPLYQSLVLAVDSAGGGAAAPAPFALAVHSLDRTMEKCDIGVHFHLRTHDKYFIFHSHES